MAKVEFNAGDLGSEFEALMTRENIRRIVEAGSAAAVKFEQERTRAAGHVITGEMEKSISAGPYHEDLNTAWQYVYPSGTGGHGQDLTVAAYVINYGYGGKRTNKTGDKFITGNKKQMDDVVHAAMTAEAERIRDEIMR